jgi:hypothetical protein
MSVDSRGSTAAGPQVFLSYVREDEEKVEELYEKLSNAAYKPWMDTKDILPGEQWRNLIPQAIRQSDFFLVCLSANSIDKRGWIQKEISQALDVLQEKLDHDIYLIPVRLEDCEVPERLREFQWVDLFEKDGWPRLLAAIEEGVKRRESTSSAPYSARAIRVRRKKPINESVASAQRPSTLMSVEKVLHFFSDAAWRMAVAIIAVIIVILGAVFGLRPLIGGGVTGVTTFLTTLPQTLFDVEFAPLVTTTLTSNPTPTPTYTLMPIPTGTHTNTSTPIPDAPTRTATPARTDTLMPPTRIPVLQTDAPESPTDTLTAVIETSIPTDIPVPPTTPVPPTSTPQTPVSTTAIPETRLPTGQFTLLKPAGVDEPTYGRTDFEWRWNGPVRADQGFEVRVWREGEPVAGVHDAVEDNLNGKVLAPGGNVYHLTVDIRDAAGVRGRGGEYLWTVALVQVSPDYQDLGKQATLGRLRFEAGGGGGDNGGGGID